MAKRILAWNEGAGQFYREIGKKPNGKPPRIYLGADEKQAGANVTRLEALWDAVEERWRDLQREDLADTPFPCWDDVTLTLARAIGKGEWTVTCESSARSSGHNAKRLASSVVITMSPQDPLPNGGLQGRSLPGWP